MFYKSLTVSLNQSILIKDILRTGGLICGGFPRSLGSRFKDCSDLDVFSSSREISERLVGMFEKYSHFTTSKYLSYGGLSNVLVKEYAVSAGVCCPQKIQLILNHQSLEETLNSFDWTVCKVVLVKENVIAYLTEDCYIDEKKGNLVHSKTGILTSRAAARICFYLEKGYTISNSELIKIFSLVSDEEKRHFLYFEPLKKYLTRYPSKLKYKDFIAALQICGYDI